ncbi:MAG: GAF domain-containing protein [Nitrospirae bacterium]|nr:GAF domain-containing protein [Nitrospirota bacterium]
MSTQPISKPGAAPGAGLNWVYDLYRIGHAVSEARVESVREQIIHHVVAGFNASTGCLALASDDGSRLTIVAAKGLPESIIGNHIEMGGGIMGKVAQKREPMLINGDLPGAGPRQSERPKSAICWPLVMDGRVIGAMSVNRRANEPPFGAGDLERGRVIVSMIAVAVENTRLYEAQQNTITALTGGAAATDELAAVCQAAGGVDFVTAFELSSPALSYAVTVFANMIGARSRTMAARARGIAQKAHAMARDMGEPAPACEAILAAATLHDVGRLALPDPLLDRPDDRLDPGPAQQARRHPVLGEALLATVPALAGAAALVRHHHENYDGTGYPDGLRNAAIPLGARIIRVVSDFHGLQDGSVQDAKLSLDQAINVLRSGCGKAYDGDIVERFLVLSGHADKTSEVSDWCLHPAELKPGMVVIRHTALPDGTELAKDTVLDGAAIQALRDLEASSGAEITVYVRY